MLIGFEFKRMKVKKKPKSKPKAVRSLCKLCIDRDFKSPGSVIVTLVTEKNM